LGLEGVGARQQEGVLSGRRHELYADGQTIRHTRKQADRRHAEEAPGDAVLRKRHQVTVRLTARWSYDLRRWHDQQVRVVEHRHEAVVKLVADAQAAQEIAR